MYAGVSVYRPKRRIFSGGRSVAFVRPKMFFEYYYFYSLGTGRVFCVYPCLAKAAE